MINQGKLNGVGGYITMSRPLDNMYLFNVNGRTVQVDVNAFKEMMDKADEPFKPFPDSIAVRIGKMEVR